MEIIEKGEITIKDWVIKDKKFFEDNECREEIITTCGFPIRDKSKPNYKFQIILEHRYISEFYGVLFESNSSRDITINQGKEICTTEFLYGLISELALGYSVHFNKKKIDTAIEDREFILRPISYHAVNLKMCADIIND